MTHEVRFADGYWFSDDQTLLDLEEIHRRLANDTYWAAGRADLDLTRRSFAGSLAFGMHTEAGMASFGRVVTDRATSAHLTDVFVLPDHRGRNLSTRMVAAILDHPELRTCRRWTLSTRDAHGVYARFGFAQPTNLADLMTLRRDVTVTTSANSAIAP